MTRTYDVVGLGNAIVDVVASVDDRFLLDHHIAKGAMTLIDEFRARELLEHLPGGIEVAGGSAANTMAGLASLGGKPFYIGKVHDDRLGALFGESLRSLGVAFATPPATEGSPTASCLVAVTADGQRSMSTYLGACRELTPHDVDPAEIAKAKALYIEGYLWDAEDAKIASRKALTAARAAGTLTSFTLSDSFCVGRFRDDFLELMKTDLDLVFANEAEAKALFEEEDWDAVLERAKAWGGLMAITRSEKGCVVVRGPEVQGVPTTPAARLIDTTGAGDQFAAGFLYGLTHGKSLADCGRLGNLAAGEAIGHYGARPEVSLQKLAAEAGLI